MFKSISDLFDTPDIFISSDNNNHLPLRVVESSLVILLHKLHAHLQSFSNNLLAVKKLSYNNVIQNYKFLTLTVQLHFFLFRRHNEHFVTLKTDSQRSIL
jgi:hypothetical protein